MDTNDAWIRQRTGIAFRHFAAPGEGASDLALQASLQAVADAGIAVRDIDYILFATMTPDHLFPGPGGILGAKLGIRGVPALDIRQQCASFPFGIQVADALLKAGAATTVLFVGAETHAGFMPWRDWDLVRAPDGDAPPDRKPAESDWKRATAHRGMSILFGDGAGAVILRTESRPSEQTSREPSARHGLLACALHSDGALYQQIYIEGGGFKQQPYLDEALLACDGHIPQMAGRELFKHAATKLPRVVHEVCDKASVAVEDVDCFVAHQANDRINQVVREALKVPEEKVPSNIARYGNTSAATIPILLDELRREGRVKTGQLVCFLALGSGLHWGAALMRL